MNTAHTAAGHGMRPIVHDDSNPINELRSRPRQIRKPGVCFPWDQASSHWSGVQADTDLVKRIWESQDAMAYYFLWQNFLW